MPDKLLLIPPEIVGGAWVADGRAFTHCAPIFGVQWSTKVLRRAECDPAQDERYFTQIIAHCNEALERIDEQMSLWREGSDICRFNALGPGESMNLPEPFAGLLGKALALSQETGGTYSPALYQAVEKWGFGASNLVNPVQNGLCFAQQAEAVQLPRMDGARVTKAHSFALDLNGIAKGYAADLLCDVIRAHPDTLSCMVDVGGEVKACGFDEGGMPFWIDIALDGSAENACYRAALFNWACATSGEAERYHTAGGRIFSHIIDPLTLASVESDLIGACVFDQDCTRADALATALLVMGAEKALAFADNHAVPCILQHRDSCEDTLSARMEKWVDHD